MSREDEWNSLMRNLPDQAFMEIMNNYLGGIKTPYDKTDLLRRLFDQLTQPENARKTAVRLSTEDLQILSAIRVFNKPSRNTLTDFFSGSFSLSTVKSRLINLEERLLIFYDRSSGNPGLVLSPILPEEIRKTLYPARLIRFKPAASPAPRELPLVNGSFMICFLSLLNEDVRICNTDGSIKKRFTSALTRVFPSSGFTDEPNETLHLLLNGLKTLSLLSEHSGEWRLKQENLRAFSALGRREQLLWIWGALCTQEYTRVGACSQLIAALADQFPRNAGIDAANLENFLHLLKASVLTEELHLSSSHIIRILKSFGFLISNGEYWHIHPMIPVLLDRDKPAEGTFFLHATYEANLTPDTPFSLPLTLSLEADRYDSFSQLRLTGDSFRRLLKAGFSLQDLNEEIQKRYRISLPQNILFSLKEWEEDYGTLRLWEGIVLEVRKDRISLVEQNSRFKNLIRRTLSEGVYLLAPEDKNEWEEAMKAMGIASIPRIESLGRKAPRALEYEFSFKETDVPALFPEGLAEEEGMDRLALEEEIHQLKEIAQNHPGLSEEEKKEIQNRIDRGVVYKENQIRPGMIRKEVVAVNGLDYQGKLRMIQSVLGNRAYMLEITLPTEDFDLVAHRVIPRALEQEKETQPLLTGTKPGGIPFQCPVRKISRIRKIRSSLF